MSILSPDPEVTVRTEDLQQFLMAVSHDLREPLRTIRCFTDLLMRLGGTLEVGDRDRFCAYVSDAAKHMERLLDDMLAFTLAGNTAAELSDVDVENVLQFALSSLRPVIVETRATVISDPLPVVTGNFGALSEVFQNLIGNGIKYHGHDQPSIRIRCAHNGEHWTFGFSDNGIGIALEHREAVFMPLKRLHSEQQYPGTGLGLAICKRIIECHGGRIWLESQPGAGSTFYFTIPRTKERSMAETA